MGLEENLAKEHVSDLNLREPIKVQNDTIVRAAVEKMRERQLGCAVIVDDSDKPVGVFSERSLVDVLTQDASLDKSTVGEFRDKTWEAVSLTDPIVDVFDAIQHRGMRFVCVVDEEGGVAGLTGQRGLSEYFADHFPGQVMVQRVGGKSNMQQREGA